MYDQSLRCCVNVTLVELAPVHTLTTAVTTPAHMKLEFPVVGHLVISIERAQKHQLI
jgi:hypothetical protein